MAVIERAGAILGDDIAVAVLAGGEGRRMGGEKPLRRLGGDTLLDRALQQASVLSDRVALAVRSPAQIGGSAGGATLISDSPVEGPLGGLAAALTYAIDQRRSAVLTLPCDMPFVPMDIGLRLGAAINGHAAALAASGGRLHPVCGLWRVAALAQLPAYAATGRRSLKGFAEAIGSSVVHWPVGSADPFFNVNTMEDLAEAKRRLA